MMVFVDIIVSFTLLGILVYLLASQRKFKRYFAVLISSLVLIVGIYIWIKNGLMLDYGTEQEIAKNYSDKMYVIGVLNMTISTLYLLFQFINLLYRIFLTRKKIC
jgi:hypothetical protein